MNIFKGTSAISLITGVAFILSGCISESAREHGSERLTATVSIPPQEYLLRQIAGDRVKVNTLLHAGSDPENYEPAINQVLDLQESRIYFTLGGLPFEEVLLQRLSHTMPHLAVANTACGISILSDHCHGAAHTHDTDSHPTHSGGYDPHVWVSPANCRIIARNMMRSLSELDPEGEPAYRARLDSLDKRLSAVDDSIRAILNGCSNRVFMVWHPSMSYFAADYDLLQLSVQQEGKEVTARQLAEAIEQARSRHPAVLFYDMAQQGNETDLLSHELHTPTYPRQLMGTDFLSEMIKAAIAIRDNQ